MLEVFKTFSFDAAHTLAGNVPAGHPYSRMHGHSFQVEVTLRGEADSRTGWIADLAEIDRLLDGVKSKLDHQFLNDIPGLASPTLENLARWIHANLKAALPGISRIIVRRGASGEGCVYTPD
jgi:6-pyruvoyltetrahydropterin/6-carboxytetrahydropterin synthase